MINQDARELLLIEQDKFRKLEYLELKSRIDTGPYTNQLKLKDGNGYQIEISVFWYDRPDGDIRVIGSADNCGSRAFVPLAESFILSPSGEFVGE